MPFAHFFWSDPLKQQAQLQAINPGMGRGGRWQSKTASFQSFIPQSETVTVPVKELDHVPSAVAKDKQRT